jgi:hypothetical protein
MRPVGEQEETSSRVLVQYRNRYRCLEVQAQNTHCRLQSK